MSYGNTRTKVKTLDVDGEEVDIFVDGDDGRFHGRLDGVDIYQTSLKALEAKLREQSRQKRRLNVEGTLLDTRWSSSQDVPSFEDIVIIGKHGGNDNLLYRGSKEKGTRQMRRFGDGDLMRRLTEGERAAWRKLCAASKAADRAKENWKKTHKLDVNKAIREQLGKAEEIKTEED